MTRNDLTTESAEEEKIEMNNHGRRSIKPMEVGEDLIGLAGGLSFSQLAISQNTQGTIIKSVLTGQDLAVMIGVSANAITSANFRLI